MSASYTLYGSKGSGSAIVERRTSASPIRRAACCPWMPRGARIKAGTRTRLHHLWDLFADQFPATPFLNGEQPGALDLMTVVVSKWSGARQHLATSRPALTAALARIEADARVAPVLARHWPAAA